MTRTGDERLGAGAQVRHAGWWRRVLARIIDGVIVFIPTALLSLVIAAVVMGTATGATPLPGVRSGNVEEGRPLAQFLITIAGLVISVAYETYFLHRRGATLGKMAVKVRVVPLDGIQGPGLRTDTALVRALTWYLPGNLSNLAFIGWIFGLFSLLNALFPLWDRPLHQSLNDKVARTRVIEA